MRGRHGGLIGNGGFRLAIPTTCGHKYFLNGNDSDTQALSSALEEYPSQGARGFDSRPVHWTSEPTGSGAAAAASWLRPSLRSWVIFGPLEEKPTPLRRF